MKAYIYSLTNPMNGEIFYVGKTENLNKRFKHHKKSEEKKPSRLYIKAMQDKGIDPVIDILQEVEDGSDFKFWETYWIQQVRAWGFNLTNVIDGTKNGKRHRHTETAKYKISQRSKLMWSDEERRIRHGQIVGGLNNAMSDKKIYDFFHEKHGHISCTQCELRHKFNLESSKISLVVNRKRLSTQGWKLAENMNKRGNSIDEVKYEWHHPKHGTFIACKIDIHRMFQECQKSGLSRLKDGILKSHKGWTVKDTGPLWVGKIQVVRP